MSMNHFWVPSGEPKGWNMPPLTAKVTTGIISTTFWISILKNVFSWKRFPNLYSNFRSLVTFRNTYVFCQTASCSSRKCRVIRFLVQNFNEVSREEPVPVRRRQIKNFNKGYLSMLGVRLPCVAVRVSACVFARIARMSGNAPASITQHPRLDGATCTRRQFTNGQGFLPALLTET